MKKISTKSKILCVVIILLIIAAAVVVALKGFNVHLKYQASQKIELFIEDEFDKADIKAITDEVLEGQDVLIQTVEMYKDMVEIISPEITDEQKESIIEKVNEKYSLEIENDDIEIESIPATRLRDVFKPYVMPMVIATLIILIYVGIRFYKLGSIKSMTKTGIIAVVAQLVLFSLIAVTRFPIGEYVTAMVLFVYLLSIFGATNSLENNLKKLKEAESDDEEE
jgi:preprotein translocase subunit SecF